MKKLSINKYLALLLFLVPFIAHSDSVVKDPNCDALLYAAQEGDLETVTGLIKEKADVNCLSSINNTPLSVAADGGHLKVIQLLLKNGANVNISNTAGVTPIYRAACEGHIEIVKELLAVPNIDVNASDDQGYSPLYCAASMGNTPIVKELLKHKNILVNQETKEGIIALFEASHKGNVETLKELLKHKDTNVNYILKDGYTILDLTKNPDIRNLLLNHGAIEFAPIIEKLSAFVQVVNKYSTDSLDAIISPNNPALKQQIQFIINNGLQYNLNITPLNKNITFIDPNNIRINGVFNAKGNNWEMNRFSTYFDFQKKENEWYIENSDFAQKLGKSYFWSFFLIIAFLLFFWLWMLSDCFKRNFKSRGKWFIFLMFGNIFAAIIYFFVIKLRH